MTAWLRWVFLLFCGAALGMPGPVHAQNEDTDTVRVRLFDSNRPSQVTLRAAEGTLRLTTGADDATTLARLDPGETATLGPRSGDVYVRIGQGGFYAQSLHVQPTSDNAHWTLAPKDRDARTYTGTLTLRPDSSHPDVLQLVNAVSLEDYVASVLASEYTLDDTEGMKAMAVVARTYALHASGPEDNPYDHVDHVHAQVYRGVDAITPAIRDAVQATRGEVLTHDGRIIQAVYSASSGGHTADHDDVWDADEQLPYLRGKRDPYDANSPHAQWQATIPRAPLLRALSNHYGRSVEGFYLGDRSDDGRVETVELIVANGENHVVPSNTFRLLVNRALPDANMKSTMFEARREGDRYIFKGNGYGHGVGLSQWGAHEMAQRGHDYRDILSFYYTDVALTTLDRAEDLPRDPTPSIASTPEPAEASEEEADRPQRIGW